MDYLSSFSLGNSTLKDLENDVKNAFICDIQQNGNQEQQLIDVVDDSPTNKKEHYSLKNHRENLKIQYTQSRTRRRPFQRNKSDSLIQNKTKVSNGSKSKEENLSDYFKSTMDVDDFSVAHNRDNSSKRYSIQRPNESITKVVTKCGNCTKDINEQELENMFGESFAFTDQLKTPLLHKEETSHSIIKIDDSSIFDENNISINHNQISENMFLEQAICSEDIYKLALDSSDILLPKDVSPKIPSPLKISNRIKNVVKESESFINVEEISFMFANLQSEAEQMAMVEKELKKCKLEVSKVLNEHEVTINRSLNNSVKSAYYKMDNFNQNLNHSIKFIHPKPENIINLSKCSSGMLNWSATSEESIAPIITKEDVIKDESQKLINNLERLKDISAWSLPNGILKEYQKKGINKMFDWQAECLSNPKVLFDHSNLVYSAPTSAGKTLVSEILTVKTVLERNKKALIILPFISVVREKMCYMQDLLTSSGYRVGGFFGGYSAPGGFDNINVAICTIEKANSIVNKLLEQQKLDNIGIIVVDEIHLISDPGRGYILELLLAKVIYICKKFSYKIQIVTMSATLSNIILLQKWLQAEYYITHFRPVELQEMIKIGTKIYDNKMQLIRELKLADFCDTIKDQDHIAQLCIETIVNDCSVIVFCPSKDWCESLSLHLANSIVNVGRMKTELGAKVRLQVKKEGLEEIKIQLRNCSAGLDSVLEKTLTYASAFHHAGLTSEERDIVEMGFKNGIVKVLVATSTLSSGVNLPARRVIIRSPLFGGKKMNSLTYKQMIGRAGRTGKDILGESILICTEANSKSGKELVCANLAPLTSCLCFDSSMHLKRALLEVISSGVALTKEDVNTFLECTLLHTENVHNKNDSLPSNQDLSVQTQDKEETLSESLKFLIDYEFVRLQLNEKTNEMNYIATRLGMACLSSSLPPNDGLLLFSELQKSRQCFVLESDLHAVYLVTPYSVCYQMHEIDWLMFLDMWETLSPAMKRVGDLVGVKESFLVRAMRGQCKLDYKALQIHKRFYTALALQELVNEVPINTVALKYKCSRGLLQSLQQMSSTFAGIVTSFCTSLNWTMLGLIVSEFKDRLFFGVHRDLIDLMKLADLNGQKARALFDAGITNLVDLANSDCFQLEKILHNCISFESEKKRDDEDDYDTNKRNALRCLYITGKSGLTVKEAAKLLINEARTYLEYEIGVENVKWSNQDSADDSKNSLGNPKELIVFNRSKTEEKRRITPEDINTPAKQKDILSSEELKTLKRKQVISHVIPRKSPRNHKTSIEKENNLNKSYVNHKEDINDKKEKENKKKSLKKRESIKVTPLHSHNKSTEEIANSQSLTDTKSVNNTRLLRSKKLTQFTKQRNEIQKSTNSSKQNKENISSSIEISNCAGSNSLLHHPLHLNSSHILSTSKDELSSVLFNCISIIDICGSSVLFKKSLSEINAAKEIGLSVAVQKLSGHRKPVIGANLLINQLSSGEKESDIDFVFDEIFFITGLSICMTDNIVLYINMQTICCDNKITKEMKILFIEELVKRENLLLKIYDAKEQLKVLRKVIPKLNVKACIEDPKVGNWLLEPDKEVNLDRIVKQYAPECVGLMSIAGLCRSSYSIGLNYNSSIIGKVRSAVESCVTVHVLKGQLENLDRINNLKKFFHDLEMPIQRSLWKMEAIGFPVNVELLANISKEIHEIMKKLEQKIYEVHGSRFNLSSTSAVARVLGLHKKSNGRLSTAKQVLEKIDSPMSNLILNYRKLGVILNKNVQPLLKCVVNNRIYGNSITFTATGRISMHEPNLQTVAKDFIIDFQENDSKLISCRSAFACSANKCLISADFCQLEMRILTHLSQDATLSKIMLSEEDIFTAIAAKWNKISQEDVSKQLREGTKAICYGIIYGMGLKSLADALKCSEEDAMMLSEQFHLAYPGIRDYTHKVIKFAKQNGYVETITGRRRYLPHINSTDNTTRTQGERQAINTTIQGSAADIEKKAILQAQHSLDKYYNKNHSSEAYLVLHLHDELIFEIPENAINKIAKILRASMVNCVQLNIPLRVKLKTGKSWGTLEEIP